MTNDSYWARSAIAHCSAKDIFQGTDRGTFEPYRCITREEFMLALARVKGTETAGGMIFTDSNKISDWTLDGVYTTVKNCWINGYIDQTIRPQRDISRSEVTKIVNLYLNRGVDDEGLTDIDYKKWWPDVEADYWAYYHIIESSNSHIL